MCTGPEVAMLFASGVSAGSAIMQGEQQKDYNEYLAKQAEADADTERQAGEIRAKERREQARRIAASARANIAASGLDVDSVTANAINADIIKRGELDALTDVDNSLDAATRMRAQASGLRFDGRQAQTGGYAQAASTIASYGAASGWYGGGGSGTTTAPATTPAGP